MARWLLQQTPMRWLLIAMIGFGLEHPARAGVGDYHTGIKVVLFGTDVVLAIPNLAFAANDVMRVARGEPTHRDLAKGEIVVGSMQLALDSLVIYAQATSSSHTSNYLESTGDRVFWGVTTVLAATVVAHGIYRVITDEPAPSTAITPTSMGGASGLAITGRF